MVGSMNRVIAVARVASTLVAGGLVSLALAALFAWNVGMPLMLGLALSSPCLLLAVMWVLPRYAPRRPLARSVVRYALLGD